VPAPGHRAPANIPRPSPAPLLPCPLPLPFLAFPFPCSCCCCHPPASCCSPAAAASVTEGLMLSEDVDASPSACRSAGRPTPGGIRIAAPRARPEPWCRLGILTRERRERGRNLPLRRSPCHCGVCAPPGRTSGALRAGLPRAGPTPTPWPASTPPLAALSRGCSGPVLRGGLLAYHKCGGPQSR